LDPSAHARLADTRWYPQRRFRRRSIPADLAGWLLDTASLTQRLRQMCAGRFSVRVLSQSWGRPLRDEARSVGMRPAGRALIRQVQLLCGNRPWVYARTVIPATSMCGRLQRLAHLGNRPLGAMLFADPGMRRGRVELARITPGQALFAAALRHTGRDTPAAIWGRRSVFRIADKPLLVSEVFLPQFPAPYAARPLWKVRE
jgi:chorismate--pyruvate lyase